MQMIMGWDGCKDISIQVQEDDDGAGYKVWQVYKVESRNSFVGAAANNCLCLSHTEQDEQDEEEEQDEQDEEDEEDEEDEDIPHICR